MNRAQILAELVRNRDAFQRAIDSLTTPTKRSYGRRPGSPGHRWTAAQKARLSKTMKKKWYDKQKSK